MGLKTDYKDYEFELGETKRKYRLINNSDGTFSLDDVTTYAKVGDVFSASDINSTNNAVNNCLAKGMDKIATLNTNESSTTFTFEQDLSNSIIDVYTSIYGYNPSEIKANGNVLTVTFDSAPKEECTVGVKVMGVY